MAGQAIGSMEERVIGVLGGMGPEATLGFYQRLMSITPAHRDQDHVRVIIDSNPKIPDRTAALLGEGESPAPMMIRSIEALERAGADFAVIPCVSAHAFLEEVRRSVRIPILSMFDAVADQISLDLPRPWRLGLMATTGTATSGHFERRLAASGHDVRLPNPEDQSVLMDAIYSIKRSTSLADRQRSSADVRKVAGRLIAEGATGIVLGCTELPLVLPRGDLDVPVFDSLLLLARAALLSAGREPIEEVPEAREAT